MQAADVVAAPLFMVEAIDESATSFYQHYGFMPAPSSDGKLFVSIKAIRASLAAATL